MIAIRQRAQFVAARGQREAKRGAGHVVFALTLLADIWFVYRLHIALVSTLWQTQFYSHPKYPPPR